MIVRDEEAHLAACLASLTGVVDEIVVVDTGSEDASVDIAAAYGARVAHATWANDFAAARNTALALTRGRWVLSIDADERLEPVTRHEVETLLVPAEEVALMVRLRPLRHYTPSLEYRLWRNDPRVRWEGVIHEKVIPCLRAVAAADGRTIGTCDLTLEHVGYDGDQTRKHLRNLPLLEAQLAVEPDNIYNWRHLARVLTAVGRADEAERALEHAVDLARSKLDEHGSVAWADLVRVRHERGDDVGELLAEGRARWPENWLLVWIEGHVHLKAGRYAAARDCFTILVEVDITTLPNDVAYDERIFGAFSHASLGLALFRLGRYAEAEASFGQAEALEPHVPDHHVKRLLAASKVAP
jgi:glycosyltransferase involved in cell wall biosynthesis